jgi:Zn-dependent protease
MNITVMEIVRMNLFLAFFNLIPIPPLDGSKVISILLSDEAALRFQSVGQMGIFLLLGLFYFTPLGEFVSYLPLQVMRYLGM